MKCKLEDICSYVKVKVDVSTLTNDTYISTENMLSNKGGVKAATSLPSTMQVQRYQRNDVLVSNIRPYFKKIWLAEHDGGCSSDVLVLRAKEGIDAIFLYYVLADDDFFDYATATSKGTKMPRGDKIAIMQFDVPLFDLATQKRIAGVLSSIDEKIALNKKINNNLEEQAFTIFNNMFPNISIGNKVVGNFISPKRGKNLLSKNAIPGSIPVIAGGLTPAIFHNEANTVAPVLTISASGANAGYVNLWNIPVWSSDSSFIDSRMTADVYFWYVMLKKRQQEIFDAQTGSAQPHIYPRHINELPIANLDSNNISKFTELVTPLFQKIGTNNLEMDKLGKLRDSLLPKLMSGEIDVASIDI